MILLVTRRFRSYAGYHDFPTWKASDGLLHRPIGLIIIRITAVTRMKVEIEPSTLYERQKITNHLSAFETSKRIVIPVDKMCGIFCCIAFLLAGNNELAHEFDHKEH
jgi:hypothetical protein